MHQDLLTIINYARYAPSSHNTQPWTIRLETTGLLVGYLPARQLSVGDPNRRELFLSLGSFVESAVLAARELGHSTDVQFLDSNDPRAIVRLSFIQSAGKPEVWSSLLMNRHSDRRPYDTQPLSPAILDKLTSLSTANAKLQLFSNPTDIDFLATMTAQATERIMTEQAFRDELAGWVRNNWTKQPDGMPGYTQGMPGPISLLAKLVIRRNKSVARSQAKQDSQRVRQSAAIGLITISEDTPANWLEAGRLYQRVCLEILSQTVKTSAVSAAVIDDATRQRIGENLALAGQPVALLRFGYKEGAVRATPRRSVSDIITEPAATS